MIVYFVALASVFFLKIKGNVRLLPNSDNNLKFTIFAVNTFLCFELRFPLLIQPFYLLT